VTGFGNPSNRNCAANGNVLPKLISQLEPPCPPPGMYRRRGPRKQRGADPFSDLSLIQRRQAEERFGRLCEKWAGNLPSWRRAILAGVARRLTLHPPGSEWGKRMRRIKGGLHCQRKYREGGRHPLAEFNQAMAKRRKEVLDAGKNSQRGLDRCLTPAQEARDRLGITPEQMRGGERIAPILNAVEGGTERAVEALRWSREADALSFLRKYDSVPPDDLKHLSIDEICVAAGVDVRRLLHLAVEGMLTVSMLKVKLQISNNLPKVTRVLIDNALNDKGIRDRRLFFEIAGLLYTPPGNAGNRTIEGPRAGTRQGPCTLPGRGI
jgi:hypothetical protein